MEERLITIIIIIKSLNPYAIHEVSNAFIIVSNDGNYSS